MDIDCREQPDKRVIGGARYGKGNHPATLTFQVSWRTFILNRSVFGLCERTPFGQVDCRFAFQALRIAVNEELHVLANAIPQVRQYFHPHFHSRTSSTQFYSECTLLTKWQFIQIGRQNACTRRSPGSDIFPLSGRPYRQTIIQV
jgi:16S rRNA C1402 N4-methylase RsmH